MARAILICGRICCGKTTYGEKLRAETNGVILSVDEVMLALFGQSAGERHDEYAGRLRGLLLKKSLEFLSAGVTVILDWGFWSSDARDRAREFYAVRGVPCELHYLSVSDEEWRERIRRRNQQVSSGDASAYLLDSGLIAKCLSLFEPPEEREIDLLVRE